MLGHIAPVFLILALGVLLRRLPQTPAALFPALEWFSFYVAFPALLLLRTAQLELHWQAVQQLALLVLGPSALVLLLCLLGLRLARQLPDAARSSVVQGAIRPSTYFGLAVAGFVFPVDVAALVMLALAIALPAVNVVAIVALTWWSGQRTTARRIAAGLLRNPIILATLAGLLYNAGGWPLPQAAAQTLLFLGNAAMALGLVCVGGGLDFRLQGAQPWAVAGANIAKLLALPAITWLACQALQASAASTLAVCFYAALPTAPNAYIMARQMGGDARLMATLITTQTLLALLSLPLWLAWLQSPGQ
ncbi:AEC family transporter [Vandammella animalimorsus]|uniref:AEC family transporter n=1 Tax=Vandammella animalimorsus TaxID=2029117 RepID=A0A3M6RIK8_9BURK|nr:AEC family transporter [Vandammella animalimorsus]RMX15061.1 AEC family transporter [Vandammella animalimorsus]